MDNARYGDAWNDRENERLRAALGESYELENERALSKQQAIDEGRLLDVDQSQRVRRTPFRVNPKEMMREPDAMRREHVPKNWRTGSTNGKAAEVKKKRLWRRCQCCDAPQTDDVNVCQNCGTELLIRKDRRGRPTSDPKGKVVQFQLLPSFAKLLESSSEVSVADFLEFWLIARSLPTWLPTATEPSEQAHSFKRGPTKRKWGDLAAAEKGCRLPQSLIQKLGEVGISTGRQLTDAALSGFEIFLSARFALCSRFGPLQGYKPFDKCGFDASDYADGLTTCEELKMVLERMKILEERIEASKLYT